MTLNEIFLLAIVLIIVILAFKILRPVIVHDYEKGVLFQKGYFRAVLDAGMYWSIAPWREIKIIDMRIRTQSVPSQEVLTADGVSIKISLLSNYRLIEPKKAILQTEDFEKSFYGLLQIALRDRISQYDATFLIEKRSEISETILKSTKHKANDLGIEILSLAIKDISFPGSVKQAFAQVARAKQEGLALLEKTRAETAALRKLANSASMLKKNPEILQLRALQSLNEGSGNTLVLNLSSTDTLPVKAEEKNR